MRVFTISDVHGQLFWKDALKGRRPGDRAVFLGDYFDRRGAGPFADDQVANFLEICSYARSNPGTALLLGNHDWQYLPWDPYGCSGRDERNLPRYRKAMMDNMDILDMVATLRPESGTPTLFSHGGVTNTFMEIAGVGEPEELNAIWKENPDLFNFEMFGPNGEHAGMKGDDIWQPPLWVRNNALLLDSLDGWNQVVGHTPVSELFSFDGHGGKILMTCTLGDRIAVIADGDEKETAKP